MLFSISDELLSVIRMRYFNNFINYNCFKENINCLHIIIIVKKLKLKIIKIIKNYFLFHFSWDRQILLTNIRG